MRDSKPSLLLVLLICLPGAAVTQDKYSIERLCPDQWGGCDLVVEAEVAKDIPGVIERDGEVLRLHAKNGVTVDRVNSGGEAGKTMWVCDYFPESDYVRICHRYLESSGTEFLSIATGSSSLVGGFVESYSPSRQRILVFHATEDGIYGIAIWRFAAEKLVLELEAESPEDMGWVRSRWGSENEIDLVPESDDSGPRYALVKTADVWQIRKVD